MSKIKYGIVGFGVAGQLHARASATMGGVELRAVCDTDAQKREAAKRRYRVRAYDDYEAMAKDETLDAVSICLPHHLHAAASIAFLKRKTPVLCEKPLATSFADAQWMIATAKTNGVLLGVVFQHRYELINRLIKEEIDQGLLGKVISTSILIKWQKDEQYYHGWQGRLEEAGGGTLISQSIHYIDLAQWFNGGVESVYGITMTARPNLTVEDNAVALVRYKNGALGTFDCSTSANPMLGSVIDIVGSLASIRVQDGQIVAWGRRPAREIQIINEKIRRSDKDIIGKNYFGNGHPLQLQDFIRSIRESKAPFVTALDGLSTLKIVLAIMESAKKQAVVTLS